MGNKAIIITYTNGEQNFVESSDQNPQVTMTPDRPWHTITVTVDGKAVARIDNQGESGARN